jgi:hypothetical protein
MENEEPLYVDVLVDDFCLQTQQPQKMLCGKLMSHGRDISHLWLDQELGEII